VKLFLGKLNNYATKLGFSCVVGNKKINKRLTEVSQEMELYMTIWAEMQELSLKDEDRKIIREILDIFIRDGITIRKAEDIIKACQIKIRDTKITNPIE